MNSCSFVPPNLKLSSILRRFALVGKPIDCSNIQSRCEIKHMAKRSGTARRRDEESLLTRAVDSVFRFIRFAEFEILFVLFFVIAFIIFKDLTSRPEYNQILVKKPGGPDWWLS